MENNSKLLLLSIYISKLFQLLSKCLQKSFNILNIKNSTEVIHFLQRTLSLITILLFKQSIVYLGSLMPCYKRYSPGMFIQMEFT